MLVILCAMSALMKESPNLHQSGQGSVYSQIISDPTGRNAYEDYLRADDIVMDPVFGVYSMWHEGSYQEYKASYDSSSPEDRAAMQPQMELAAQLNGMNFLDIEKAELGRYGSALDIVRSALQKDVWQPRKGMDSNTLFPEYLGFKNIARLFVADAYVDFAEGRADQGSNDLIDLLRFSDHMPAGPVIAPLVSSAMDAIAFAAIQVHMNRITHQGWLDLADLCQQHLSDNGFFVASLKWDNRGIDASLAEAATSPDPLKDLLVSFSSSSGQPTQGSEVTAVAGSSGASAPITIPPAEASQLLQDAKPYVDQYYADAAQRFSGPEQDWRGTPPVWQGASDNLPANPTYSELLAALVDSVTINFDILADSFSMRRAQWRLLRVHALIQAYRWEHNQLPGRIQEVATEEDLTDPFSGKKLVYARLDSDRYRLYSAGTSKWGEVELKYRRRQP